ncbi:MAG: hypothetical protein ACKOFM_01860 [Actinomycetota bacterium]
MKVNLRASEISRSVESENWVSDLFTVKSIEAVIPAFALAMYSSVLRIPSWLVSLGTGCMNVGFKSTNARGAISSKASKVRVSVKYRGSVCRSDSCQNISARPMSMVNGTIHHRLRATPEKVSKSNEIRRGASSGFT